MTLKNRCLEQLYRMRELNLFALPDKARDVLVDELSNFVRAEIGRAADDKLTDSEPLVLYFADKQSRADFLAAILEAKPGMISKRWPI